MRQNIIAVFDPTNEAYFPAIVIIIDELADLMMTAGKDVETLIARLAQMARAAGIHLIVAYSTPICGCNHRAYKSKLPQPNSL